MTSLPSGHFRTGLWSAIPVALGYFPISFSFGVAATRADFLPLEAIALSLIIYAGASQFLALALLASGAPLLVTALTLMAMNLRHMVYGPALLSSAGAKASTRHAWGWGFWLTDETFGTALGDLSRRKIAFSEPYMFGLGFGAYAAWVGGTAAGAFAGAGVLDAYPAVSAGLGFMLTALFLALLLSILSRAALPAIIAAVAVTIAGSLLMSPTVGLLAGILLGAGIGAIVGGRNET